MPITRTRQDARFFEVVKDLEWRLDDSGGGRPPEPADPHGEGGGGGWPRWATHMIAFLLGGLTWGSLLLAPPLLPVLALTVVIALTTVAVKRRWH